MLILAMDFSSSISGMVLLDGDDIRAERQWSESPSRNQQVFPALLALLKDGRCRPEDLDLFAVGVGPGTFSGLRVALATAQGMALPSDKPVIGVSSGEAIAWDVCRETSARHVTVVGDARRRRLWITTVETRGGGLPLPGEYTSIPEDALSSHLVPETWVASPDWLRIGGLIDAAATGAQVVRKPAFPNAPTIGRIARLKAMSGTTPPPPSIIYVHPPVA
jgi:tRNA threonylcarbamoyladenosine biosynthesis protein TsaB